MATSARAAAPAAGVLRAVNPATGEHLGDVPAASPEEVRAAVERARTAQAEWGALPPQARVRHLREVRRAVYRDLETIVETVSAQCGKPRAEALSHDVMPAVLTMAYLERLAPRALRPDRPAPLLAALAGVRSRVEYRPYGVVGVISPWNYPFFLAVMGTVPALLAGNTVVLKPSEVTPGVGERLRTVFSELPAGVVEVVQGGADVGAALVDAPCDKICFIGSPATGRRIAEAAARHLTPVVMELGGQDAAIVCEDADVDVASSGVLWGSFLNCGQACAAVERVYVAEAVADDFVAALADKLQRLRQGLDGDVGSLTTPRQLETLRRHLDDALAHGARVVAGGPDRGPRRGGDGTLWAFPTVIEGRGGDMAIFSEETFGPLLPVVRVRDDDEAVARANSEGVNLTASVWTRSPSRARALASALRAGTVSVNSHAEAAGAPWAPWGGLGESGYGRLQGVWGIREFTVPTHVAVNALPRLKRPVWYPYGPDSTELLGAVTELLSAPGAAQRLRAAGRVASRLVGAFREKL